MTQMAEEKDSIITYDSIFELLRKERGGDLLQKVGDNFYSETAMYLKEKQGLDDKEIVHNIKKILKEIYERREKKIVGLAVDRCRLGTEGRETSHMLKEEKRIYEQIVEGLMSARHSILDIILIGKSPESRENLANPGKNVDVSQNSKEILSEKKNTLENGFTLVRFLHAVPKFVGKELEIYGPFESEDIANVPTEIAVLLIAKGRAEEIKEK